jgi:retinol dehydrogenase 14
MKVLITGSTDGIGSFTALELARLDHEIVLHGRDDEKLAHTQKKIIELTGNSKVSTIKADFSSLKDVDDMAKSLFYKLDKLDCLINNAGVFCKEKNLSIDGFELTMVVNYLSHFHLTLSLLPLLEKSTHSRIIHVSSVAHKNAKVEMDNLNSEKLFTSYNSYAVSKLFNILFSIKLSDRLPSQITSNSLHPGVIDTKLLRTGFAIKGSSLEEGCDNSIYLATSNEVTNITGKYYEKRSITPIKPIYNNQELIDKIYNWSEEQIKKTLYKKN